MTQNKETAISSSLHLAFEAQLDHFLNTHDTEGVRQLVAATVPFVAVDRYLQQWYTYALSYLAGQNGENLNEAIGYLERLYAEYILAPRLRERVLNALGIVYEMNEQWDRALYYYQQSIGFYEAEQNYLRLGVTLYNLAIIYWKGTDYTTAAKLAQRSIDLLDQNHEDQEWQLNLSEAYNTLGFTQMKWGKLGEARLAFEQSLAICERYEAAFNQGVVCNNLGQVYRRLGETEKAIHYYERAYALTIDTQNHRETAEVAYGLGMLKLETAADIAEVDHYFDEALHRALANNNHEIITDIFLSRALVQEQQGNLAAALAETQQAVATVESLRANIVLPDDRARMTAARVEAYEQMVRRLCQVNTTASISKAFHYAEMAKARTFIEVLGRRGVRSSGRVPPEWLTQEQVLRQQLHALYQNAGANQERIAQQESELQHLRERIRLHDTEFQSFHTVKPLTVAEVQARLPTGALLLEYFTIGDEILVFTVTAQHLQVTRLALRVSELQRTFKQVGENQYGPLHNLTRNANHYLRQPWILAKLYQQLIEPLGVIVQAADLLCIAPHGLLHYVPFHALYQQSPTGPRYLTEREGAPRPLLYAPSATALLDYCQTKPRASGAGCLALGYNGATLSQAEHEAQSVVQTIGGMAYCDHAATRTALLAQAHHYRYVHLSCHGWFNPTWPLASAITLADGTLDVADALRELVLNAELVCLSACETGRSHILRGDELIGLTRAFLYAGAPAVLVSQWVVDELSTRLLFERFYSELQRLQNQPTPPLAATALALSRAQSYLRQITTAELAALLQRQATDPQAAATQLQFLVSTDPNPEQQRPFAHPYYWAPFFLVGDRLTTP